MQLPAADRLPETAVRPGGRLHRGGEPATSRQAQLPDSCSSCTKKDSRRGAEPGSRRRGRGRLAVGSSRHPDDYLHRLHRSRRMVALAAARSQEGQPRAGRQEPQVIFPDADLDAAWRRSSSAPTSTRAMLQRRLRLLVHADIADEFTARIVQRSQDVRVGDPLTRRRRWAPDLRQASRRGFRLRRPRST